MRLLMLIGILGGMTVYGGPTSSGLQTNTGISATAKTDWHYVKEDPKTKKKLAVINATSFANTDNPFVFKLNGVTGSIYNPADSSYSTLNFHTAIFDERSGALISGKSLKVFSVR